MKTRHLTRHLSGLYAITDTQLMPGEQLLEKVEAGLRGGISLVQYRDKSAQHLRRRSDARALAQLCHRYGRPLLINDDIELAAEVAAAGVHLGQGDAGVADARLRLGADSIIGITCHDRLDLALQAQAEGADYVAFGAFFPSSTKPGAIPAAIQLLDDARQQLDIPIVAIGGIRVDNASKLIEPGADMVAVIHSLFATDDVEARARQFSQLFVKP